MIGTKQKTAVKLRRPIPGVCGWGGAGGGLLLVDKPTIISKALQKKNYAMKSEN